MKLFPYARYKRAHKGSGTACSILKYLKPQSHGYISLDWGHPNQWG